MKTELRLTASLTALNVRIIYIYIYIYIYLFIYIIKSSSVTARSKAWACGRFLAGTVGSNPGGIMDV